MHTSARYDVAPLKAVVVEERICALAAVRQLSEP
jgi:hypothetical protein